MAPKDDKGPVATLIDIEKWPTVCGENAERDFLYVVEVFCKSRPAFARPWVVVRIWRCGV